MLGTHLSRGSCLNCGGIRPLFGLLNGRLARIYYRCRSSTGHFVTLNVSRRQIRIAKSIGFSVRVGRRVLDSKRRLQRLLKRNHPV